MLVEHLAGFDRLALVVDGDGALERLAVLDGLEQSGPGFLKNCFVLAGVLRLFKCIAVVGVDFAAFRGSVRYCSKVVNKSENEATTTVTPFSSFFTLSFDID